MSKKLLAEAFGTFWLVLAGCGSALLAAGFPNLGIGFLGVAFAFGLSVLTMAYAVGGISGGHFNPAVSVGMAIAGRFEWRSVTPYVIAQLLGACAAAIVLFVIVSGKADFAGVGTFAANGYGAHSPGGYSLAAALVTELVMTGFFLFIILGATAPAGQPGFAPIAIGLTLTLIHLVSIPVTNTSVNPARSTAMALFSEPWALAQLWLFWVAPIAGAALGALCWKALMEAPAQPVASTTSVTAGKA